METIRDISSFSPASIPDDWKESCFADISQLEELASKPSLRIVACSLSDLTLADQADYPAWLANATDELQAAASHAVRLVSLGLGPYSEANFIMGVEAVRQLVPLARQLGLFFCIRNGTGTSLEQLDELHVFFRDADCRDIRLELDAAAFQDAAVNPCDAILSFLPRLASVRLRERKRPIDRPTILDALQREHFEGILAEETPDSPGSTA